MGKNSPVSTSDSGPVLGFSAVASLMTFSIAVATLDDGALLGHMIFGPTVAASTLLTLITVFSNVILRVADLAGSWSSWFLSL